MKTKLILVLLALGILGLIVCCSPKRNPPIPIYQIAIELLDQQGVNISQIAGAKTTGEVLPPDSIIKLIPSFSSMVAGDNIRYFILRVDAHISRLSHTALIWKVKCMDVFGNEDTHTVESKWEPSGDDNLYKRCLSFEFEGKTYTPEMKNGYWTARVIVNR